MHLNNLHVREVTYNRVSSIWLLFFYKKPGFLKQYVKSICGLWDMLEVNCK